MRRRDFIALLGGAAAWPVGARAQSSTMPRIGVLNPFAENDPESRNIAACPASALVRQIGRVEEGRISGSS
jgi:hypothetical protein